MYFIYSWLEFKSQKKQFLVQLLHVYKLEQIAFADPIGIRISQRMPKKS